MVTVLAIIWVIAFVSVIFLAIGLGIADAFNVASSEKSIYPEPEDLE